MAAQSQNQNMFAIEKLRGRENYNNWATAVEALLVHEDCWDCIEGTQDNNGQMVLNQDARKQQKVKSKITLLVSPVCYAHIRKANNAQDAWNNLKKAYADDGTDSCIGLLDVVCDTKLMDCESEDDYVSKILDAIEKLRESDFEIGERYVGAMLLRGLPPEYGPMVMALSNSTANLTGDFVKNKIMKDVRYFANKNSVAKNGAGLFASSRANYQRERTSSSRGGASRRGAKNNRSFDQSRVRCFKCNNTGHVARNCFRSRGAARLCINQRSDANNNESQDNGEGKESREDELVMVSFISLLDGASNDHWVIDSGASTHLCNNEKYFSNLKPVSKQRGVLTAENRRLEVKGVGDVHIKVGDVCIKLTNVLFCPGLICNLLAVTPIIRAGFKVIFQRKYCHILTNEDVHIVTGEFAQNDVYTIKSVVLQNIDKIQPNVCFNVIHSTRVKAESTILWHKRLGHMNLRYMQLLRDGAATGISFNDNHLDNCLGCALGKHKRKPFHQSQSRATQKLQLIHSDLCVVDKVSKGGARYVLTFLDDYSRKIFVYFLKAKSGVFEAFKSFKNFVENQSDRKVKVLRTDNGGEYMSQQMSKFLDECGIKHETSVPYNPQQNGRAERVNSILVEKATAMLQDSGLDKSFWAEAVNTAGYLANRVPKKCLSGKTPEEVWSGKQPDLTNLKIFGCKAQALIPKELRKKFEAKSKECIMMGYCDTQKAYRLWDPKKRDIFAARDVIFFENEMYCKRSKSEPVISEVENAVEVLVPIEENNEPVQIVEMETNLEDGIQEDQKSESNVSPIDSSQSENSKSILESSSSSISDSGSGSISIGENQQVQILDKEHQVVLSQRPKRARKLPIKLKDYIVGLDLLCMKVFTLFEPQDEHDFKIDSMRYSFPNEDTFNIDEQPFYVFIAQVGEPECYDEAITSSEAVQWTKAMMSEINSIKSNNTWELCELPYGRKPVSCKWVYKRKRNVDGSTKFKARLVARGFTQQAGVDYDETYSPVVRFSTLRLLIAHSVQHNLQIYHLDVECAFLHGDLTEDIYMTQPEGFVDQENPTKVCKLFKAIYGLKQGNRAWHQKVKSFLTQTMKLCQSNFDQCVYYFKEEKSNKVIYVGIFVDDFIVFTNSNSYFNLLKNGLTAAFPVKDLGLATNIFGIEIQREDNNTSITLNQTAYVNSLLHRFNMKHCGTCKTPLDLGSDLSPDTSLRLEDEKQRLNTTPYQQAIGSFMYLYQATRPDLGFVLSYLSRFNKDFTMKHWSMVKHVFRYLQYTKDYKLTYTKNTSSPVSNDDSLKAYCDASWGSKDISDPKSTTGYVFISHQGAISWCSKRQNVCALSTVEAEYYAISATCQEAVWLINLCKELGIIDSGPITINADNQGAINLGKNANYSNKTKHINLRHHFIKNLVESCKIKLNYVRSNENVADSLTKPVSFEILNFCNNQMGLK